LANYIPDEKVIEVRNRADIIEIISEAVRLKRTGKNYLGLCPFHTEKTPSFTVSPDKQIFHCFGCGEGGNVFSFMMKHAGFSFPEAVRQVARRYGIDIPRQSLTPDQRKRISRRERLLKANQKAMAFYQNALMKTPAGGKALEYLRRRGINDAIIETFALGFAPDGWQSLTDHLKKTGFTSDLARSAGLIVQNRQANGYYDRFRNRIIFPIFDLGEQVVGFGGRVMGDGEPKYLNSPESPVYNKRRILYGLNRSRQACRRSGIIHIVEGYFDLLTLYQHGIENTAATLGTALTEEHIRLIKGHAERTVLVFDADEGGIKAALRSCNLFLQAGIDARVLVLPDGHDPDSFVRESGADAFRKAGEKAPGIIGFIIDSAVGKFGLSIEGKIRIISQLQLVLADIDDPVARSLYIRELSERIEVDECAIQEKIRQSPGKKKPGFSPGIQNVSEKKGEAVTGRAFKLEKLIVAMLLQYPDMIPDVEQSGIIDRFSDQRLRSVGRQVIENKRNSGVGVPDLIEMTNDPDLKRIIASLAMGDDDSWSRKGCLQLITQYQKISDTGRHRFIEKIKAAEAAGDYEKVARLQQQWTLKKKPKIREAVDME
jgi:DNA primase